MPSPRQRHRGERDGEVDTPSPGRIKGNSRRKRISARPSLGCLTDGSVLRRVTVYVVLLVLALLLKAHVYSLVDLPPERAGDCDAMGWDQRPATEAANLRVFDSFAFNSEYDVLETRLHELDAVVDAFVLVEARYTFSGKRKPLFFDQDKNNTRWAPFLHKIVHVVVDDSEFAGLMPNVSADAVRRKVITKSGVVTGLDRAGASPDDYVIFSDVDEVPRGHVIATLRSCTGFALPLSLHTPYFMYDFGCRINEPPFWERIRVAKRSQLKKECDASSYWAAVSGTICPDGLRDPQRLRLGLWSSPVSVRDGGWHMTYFMTETKFVEKIESISHIQSDNPRNKNRDMYRCLLCKCRHVDRKRAGIRSLTSSTADTRAGPEWLRSQAAAGVMPYAAWFRDKADVCDDLSESVLSVC